MSKVTMSIARCCVQTSTKERSRLQRAVRIKAYVKCAEARPRKESTKSAPNVACLTYEPLNIALLCQNEPRESASGSDPLNQHGRRKKRINFTVPFGWYSIDSIFGHRPICPTLQNGQPLILKVVDVPGREFGMDMSVCSLSGNISSLCFAILVAFAA